MANAGIETSSTIASGHEGRAVAPRAGERRDARIIRSARAPPARSAPPGRRASARPSAIIFPRTNDEQREARPGHTRGLARISSRASGGQDLDPADQAADQSARSRARVYAG